MTYEDAVDRVIKELNDIPDYPQISDQVVNFDDCKKPAAFLIDDEEDLESSTITREVYTQSRALLHLWLVTQPDAKRATRDLRGLIRKTKRALLDMNTKRVGFWAFVKRVEYRYDVAANSYAAARVYILMGSYEG